MDRHPYELFLQPGGIEAPQHPREAPHSNGIVSAARCWGEHFREGRGPWSRPFEMDVTRTVITTPVPIRSAA